MEYFKHFFRNKGTDKVRIVNKRLHKARLYQSLIYVDTHKFMYRTLGSPIIKTNMIKTDD